MATLLTTSPLDLALDSAGQLVIPLRHTTGVAGVAQLARVRLLLFKGEWFIDLDEGTPWLENDGVDPSQVILGEAFDAGRAEAVVRARLAGTPGLARVTRCAVAFDGADRVLTIDWAGVTVFGNTVADVLEQEV